MVERLRKSDRECQHQHDERDTDEEYDVSAHVVEEDAETEALEEAPRRKTHRLFSLRCAQILSQESKRRQAQFSVDDDEVDDGHQDQRQERRDKECIHIPEGLVFHEAVGIVVQRDGRVLEERVAEEVSGGRCEKCHDDRHQHVVAQDLASRIARRTKSTDNGGFIRDRVAGRDREDEGQHADEDIHQNGDQRFVGAHVVRREVDRLVGIFRHEILEFVDVTLAFREEFQRLRVFLLHLHRQLFGSFFVIGKTTRRGQYCEFFHESVRFFFLLRSRLRLFVIHESVLVEDR